LTPPASQRENRIALSVEGLINVGQFISTSLGTGGLDLIALEPRPGSQLTLPTSYGGMRRIFIRQNQDGRYDLVERRLVGVSFCQTALPTRHIIGHGSDSLFNHLYLDIVQQWP
jgi:hypothetical protein